LQGSDVRGGKIEGIDYYLVNVRDAKFDSQQAEHLRRCGAIIKTRAV
jgi:hypothetical protein